jgi:hypothetical protein
MAGIEKYLLVVSLELLCIEILVALNIQGREEQWC